MWKPATPMLLGLLALGSSWASAEELLTNGGAETGDLSGWVLDGSEFPSGDAVFGTDTVAGSETLFPPVDGVWVFEMDAVQTGAPLNSGVVARMSQTAPAPPEGTMLSFTGSVLSSGPSSCDPARVRATFQDADGLALPGGVDTDWVLSTAGWQGFSYDLIVPARADTVEVELLGRLDCGVFIDTFFDAISLRTEPCSSADFAPPHGVLDFFDVLAFLAAFSAMDQSADLVDDDVFDFFDLQVFLQAFSAGCP
jgi:hypothetical protein